MFNKKISLLLVGAMGIVFLITGSAYADCPAGMVSYWNLDETSGDKYADVFDGNDGTGNNNPTATAGRVNGGQQFAAGTGIDVPPDNAFNWAEDDSFSIEFWIKRNGAPGAAQVAIGRDAGNPGTSLHWWVGIDAGDNVITFSLGDNDGGSITDVVGATSITNDAWHHVVAVRNSSLGADGQNLLYIDGNLDTAAVDADYDAGFDSATAELNIGRLDLAPGYQFVGGLDEVALYNRALPQSEIQTHYSNGLSGRGIDYVAPGGGGGSRGGGGGGGGGCFIAIMAE